MALQKAAHAGQDHAGRVLARHGQQVFAVQGTVAARRAQDRGDVLLQEVGLPLFHQQHGASVGAELQHLLIHHWVGDVHDVDRHGRAAEEIGQPQVQQHAQQGVVVPPLHDDADALRRCSSGLIDLGADAGGCTGSQHLAPAGAEALVQPALADEAHRRRPALTHLFLLMHKAGGRQDDAAGIAARLLHGLTQREVRAAVGAGRELPMHVAGADA